MLRIIALLSVAVLVLGSKCPPNEKNPDQWISDDNTGRCYHKAKIAYQMGFQLAKSFCESQNAQMGSIHDGQDEEFIKNQLFNFPYAPAGMSTFGTIYLGLQKIDETWQWLDGTPLDYTNWESDEAPLDPGKDCAVIRDRATMAWSSVECDEGQAYATAVCYL